MLHIDLTDSGTLVQLYRKGIVSRVYTHLGPSLLPVNSSSSGNVEFRSHSSGCLSLLVSSFQSLQFIRNFPLLYKWTREVNCRSSGTTLLRKIHRERQCTDN